MACHSRDSIKTGDLLAWSDYSRGHSSFWLKVVRFLTSSEYGHVSVAWRINGVLFHVEAVMPKIRLTPVREDESFFHLPIAKEVPQDINMELYFSDKIGKDYSVVDAIRAYFGLSVKDDDKWQCAELAADFYKHHGLDLGAKPVTPSGVVYAALNEAGVSLVGINANKPCPFVKESIQNG